MTGPTAIMELINKVQINAAGAQLSIAAPLSSSAKIPQGNITRQDIMGVYVYENFLFGVNMTGRQLKNWLEWSVRYYKQVSSPTDSVVKDTALNIADYNLDQLYGATYDIDLTQPACTTDANGYVTSGDRIKNLRINGKLVKDTDVFKVAINNYRYNGGGGFMAAAGFTPGSAATTAATYYDSAKALGDDGQVRNMMFKYVQDNGTISPTCSNNWKIYTTPVPTVQLGINPAKKIVEVGEDTSITITANSADGLYGFDLSFNYDSTLFDIKDISGLNGFKIISADTTLNNGKVRIIGVLLGLPVGLNGNVDLVKVNLTAKRKDAIGSFKVSSRFIPL